MFKSLSLTTVVAGFIAVLVGFTSSAVIIFQAASAAGASPAEVSSWLAALGIGMGVTSIGLSLRYRMPVLTAWSTPGAALLVTSLAGVPMSAAIGAFVFSAILITLCGVTGLFEKMMDRIPKGLAAAMLAGVLVHFGLNVFSAMQTQLLLALAMFVTYLIAKRVTPRYAIILVLAIGVIIAGAKGLLHFDNVTLAVAQPVWTTPTFDLTTLIGVGIPLFVVTMASQNVPGVAVIRASGYNMPISPLITWTGIASLVLAPFGGYALNLAAITAAICMGKEAHEQPEKRYMASIWAGFFYLITGVFAATIAGLFAAFPKELVLTIAGLALFTTISNSMAMAMHDDRQREPALITFLITASGLTLFGIGSAFWGLIGGVLAMLVLNWGKR
ncbi:benzoate/H(+) symporter BenE family transporter [Pokkaliibacter sp. MBI-7]|uniref:benzoate/H(+) symporter BenE family transporter n=1 Tax=Pokkaliibacter sp. MBI-7 TaxID=3040600 RepID=UPI002448FC52|nr:benzoate/H(+) symporter BenE family transporter [Pokkaliibacter sp. MBI-7]MDH2435790.1 benzoate/H(+) symporter BenE family transporter [Pokkaliibacter sp. MBI-7]